MRPAPTNPVTPAMQAATIVIANGRPIECRLPCSIEAFLLAQNLLPRSVVVEHSGEGARGGRKVGDAKGDVVEHGVPSGR